MADVQYRGRATGALYSFDIGVIPSTLLDQYGNLHAGQYNNELCIPANRDGSVMNPQAMGVPVGNPDIFSAYVNFPDWWTNDASEQF